ncbi:MAG TPA: multiheme c-type cytochrome [Isosphaeraceae bacterium]|nr:multiheme c-type cytochrome [Isosphaeraceae bacterium]
MWQHRMTWRVCGSLVLVAGVSLVARSAQPQPFEVEIAPVDSRTSPSTSRMTPWRGVGSCSAAACHGAAGPAGLKGGEFTTWATVDRHARAYAVLFSERSLQIEQRYRGRQGALAEHDRLCLSCHDHLDEPFAPAATDCAVREGVGCESCHGASGRWLGLHNTYTWKGLSTEAKEALGMKPTKKLPARARSCITCHVGAPGSEVNHDLIAAGHPRLNFELSAFLSVMPKHWSERDDKTRYPDLEARAWAVGQVASAQAALRLLSARARSASDTRDQPNRTPWPEFAEYSCYACHHDLNASQPGAASTGHSRGTPAWGGWYLPMLSFLADSSPAALPTSSRVSLDALQDLMRQPLPPADRVANQAEAAAQSLEGSLDAIQRRPLAAEDVRSLFAKLARAHRDTGTPRWEQDAQLYLALAALYHAQGDLDPSRRDPQLRPELDVMNQALRFPASFDSPTGYVPAAFDRALGTVRARLDR